MNIATKQISLDVESMGNLVHARLSTPLSVKGGEILSQKEAAHLSPTRNLKEVIEATTAIFKRQNSSNLNYVPLHTAEKVIGTLKERLSQVLEEISEHELAMDALKKIGGSSFERGKSPLLRAVEALDAEYQKFVSNR